MVVVVVVATAAYGNTGIGQEVVEWIVVVQSRHTGGGFYEYIRK